jgi:hypothetical protein
MPDLIMAWVLVFCTPMKTARKVTVILPAELLRRAQKSTGKGITPTIRRGLELVAAAKAYQQLRQLRGRVKFSVDLDSLREDRDRD